MDCTGMILVTNKKMISFRIMGRITVLSPLSGCADCSLFVPPGKDKIMWEVY